MTYPIEQQRTRHELPWIAAGCVLIGLLLVAFGTVSRVSSQVDAKTSVAAAEPASKQQIKP